MQLYLFLRENITYENYLGEGRNNDGKVKVLFKVKDNEGRNKVMAISPSDELIRCSPEDADTRPVRTILTVFFMEERAAVSKLLTRMY